MGETIEVLSVHAELPAVQSSREMGDWETLCLRT